jgi:transcriptional regulator with XRE-family HTH domain
MIMDSTVLKKEIGKKIEQIRTVKGWSRDQVADKIKMSVAGYGSIARGETDIRLSRLAQLAEIFDITLSDLLGLTEKTVFNFTGTHNKECHHWQVNSTSTENELTLQHELEKCQIIQQSQQKEIEYLRELNELLKKNLADSS